MMRNLKALGLALVAVFAMSALASSTASATFHSSLENTSLSGEQTETHEFTVNTGVVVCGVAKFSGFQEKTTAETVSIVPEYKECEFQELFEVTVNVNGCDYVFHASSETEGTVDIATCGANKYIQVGSVFTCRVRVPEQEGKGPISYATEGKGQKVTAAVTNLTYEETGLFCSGEGGENGEYSGPSVVTGKSGEEEAVLTVS